jgi:hypothetical protein
MDKICPILTSGYYAHRDSKLDVRAGKITSRNAVYCLREKCSFWDEERKECKVR